MFHLAEDIDSVTLETRAESAQVGSGYEVVDAVATKIALDQERRITREPGDSVAETTNKKKFSPTRLDLVPTSTALVLASQPVSAVDELATLVASIATEYNSLDSEINDLTDDLLVEERKLAVRYRDELLPRIGQMQMLLSQRGALRELVANDRSLLGALAQLEDIPTWTEWYEAFASRFQGAKSLRTIQRQLKKLRGGTGPMAGADTSLAGDDSDGGADERTSHSGLYRDAEGKSIMSDAMRITRAVSLVKDLQRALEEGFLFEATPAPPSKAPLLEGEVVSDQVRGAYAKLRSVFNRMADTADIENALQLALEEFVQPMMAEHPYLQVETPYRPELQISVTLKRAGRARISAGDWVDYRGGDDRLTKQIGAEASR
jgi:hypothetical protein